MMGQESDEARERLQILEQSNDGFHVASEDLKRRGQGDLFGTLQSGEKVFALADIYEDARVLEAASEEAKQYSLEKLFSDGAEAGQKETKKDFSSKKDLTNAKGSFRDAKNQNERLLKKVSQYMGDITL